MTNAFDPKLIPEHKKRQFLASFSEDDFRDTVVRPLLLCQGLRSGKDTCGTDEEGKDCYFWQDDKVRGRTLVAVQTKKGNLKLSSSAKENLIAATTQLRTALATYVNDSATKQKHQPSCVILVASGDINAAARKYVVDEVNDPRVLFKDCSDLIPEIDNEMPEFWNGIDAAMLPYLKRLRDELLKESVTIDVSAIGLDGGAPSPITDETFAQIYVSRIYPTRERHGKDVKDKLEVEEIQVQQLLARRERLILLTGDAGCGKTTALFRLAYLLIQRCLGIAEDPQIPVLMTAKEVLNSNETLAVTASNHTKSMTIDGAPAFDIDALRNGRVELLIDGLDELAGKPQRDVVVQKVAEFNSAYSRCQLIVASRDYLFVRELVTEFKFARFRVTPLSFHQASKMIERVSKGQSLSKSDTEETLRRLEDVHGLQLNPLLITVFVATSDYARSDIPANITEIFKKFSEVMLGRWGVTKGISQQYQAPLKDFLLQKVAFYMHSRKETTMSSFQFKSIIHDELLERGHEADIDTLFDEIVNRSGLVREHEGEIEFTHLLLQEFFAGRAIPSQEFLGSVVSDVWWTKAIVFFFGENPGDSHALEALRNGLAGVVGADEFQAAVTVGLAAQACYLMKSVEKTAAMAWVVRTLSDCKTATLLELTNEFPDMEILPLIHYYVYGRDAVAGRVIVDTLKRIEAECQEAGIDVSEEEVFWCLAGMIEARKLDEVLDRIKSFNPKDPRLLLSLHMGALYVEHIHVTDNATRATARKIVECLDRKIDFMRPQIVKELTSLLLEVRKGTLSTIEPSASAPQSTEAASDSDLAIDRK